jgi:hypothetical protein
MIKRTIIGVSNVLSRFRKLAFVSLIAVAPASAFASIVTYDFTLNGGSSGLVGFAGFVTMKMRRRRDA